MALCALRSRVGCRRHRGQHRRSRPWQGYPSPVSSPRPAARSPAGRTRPLLSQRPPLLVLLRALRVPRRPDPPTWSAAGLAPAGHRFDRPQALHPVCFGTSARPVAPPRTCAGRGAADPSGVRVRVRIRVCRPCLQVRGQAVRRPFEQLPCAGAPRPARLQWVLLAARSPDPMGFRGRADPDRRPACAPVGPGGIDSGRQKSDPQGEALPPADAD